MEHKSTVTLETKRLILRQFTLNDAGAMFHNWASDPAVTKFLRWSAHSDISVSEYILHSWIAQYEKPDYYNWAIVPKDMGEPIGSIGVVEQRDDIKMVHIGYAIGKKWWGQGYTAEALAALEAFFFEEVGINRMESMHDPRNPGSGKVMRKCGFQYEGTFRQGDISIQGIVDTVKYAILAQDYFSRKQTGFSVQIGDISIDCKNPASTCAFYHALTGWAQKTMYGCPALITENSLVILFTGCDFAYIRPVWPEEPEKQQKQIHFNCQVNSLSRAVEKALELGATKPDSQYGGGHFVTMLDPEGHPFCLCRMNKA